MNRHNQTDKLPHPAKPTFIQLKRVFDSMIVDVSSNRMVSQSMLRRTLVRLAVAEGNEAAVRTLLGNRRSR